MSGEVSRRELSVGNHPYSKKVCLSVTEFLDTGGAVTKILARFDKPEYAKEFLEIINGEEGEQGVWHGQQR